jgi:hypothetical protein
MTHESISIEAFRDEVEQTASAMLNAHGFARSCELEIETPTTASVVYVGQHVALTFTFDVRDGAVDLVVSRYSNGRILARSENGYSNSLFSHLVEYCNFRGRSLPSRSLPDSASKTRRALSALVNLLAEPCATDILADRNHALSH